jgi:hypothetical protein
VQCAAELLGDWNVEVQCTVVVITTTQVGRSGVRNPADPSGRAV